MNQDVMNVSPLIDTEFTISLENTKNQPCPVLSNSKQQFADSPDLTGAILDAIMDAFDAHSVMSKQALDSEHVRSGLRDILLGPGQLYEALRGRSEPRA